MHKAKGITQSKVHHRDAQIRSRCIVCLDVVVHKVPRPPSLLTIVRLVETEFKLMPESVVSHCLIVYLFILSIDLSFCKIPLQHTTNEPRFILCVALDHPKRSMVSKLSICVSISLLPRLIYLCVAFDHLHRSMVQNKSIFLFIYSAYSNC